MDSAGGERAASRRTPNHPQDRHLSSRPLRIRNHVRNSQRFGGGTSSRPCRGLQKAASGEKVSSTCTENVAWYVQDSQGQILALPSRRTPFKHLKVMGFRWDARERVFYRQPTGSNPLNHPTGPNLLSHFLTTYWSKST